MSCVGVAAGSRCRIAEGLCGHIVDYQNKERKEDMLHIAAFALGMPLQRMEERSRCGWTAILGSVV